MKKKIFLALLSCSMFIPMFNNVNAFNLQDWSIFKSAAFVDPDTVNGNYSSYTDEDGNVIYQYTFDENELSQIAEKSIDYSKYGNIHSIFGISTVNNQYVFESRLVAIAQSNWSPWTVAYGQPALGVIAQKGMRFYWDPSSKVKTTWNFSITLGGKAASFTVGLTPGSSTSSTTGYSFEVPSSYVGHYCTLMVRQKYIVYRYAIYAYDMYQGEGSKFFYSYQDIKKNGSYDWKIQKLK